MKHDCIFPLLFYKIINKVIEVLLLLEITKYATENILKITEIGELLIRCCKIYDI